MRAGSISLLRSGRRTSLAARRRSSVTERFRRFPTSLAILRRAERRRRERGAVPITQARITVLASRIPHKKEDWHILIHRNKARMGAESSRGGKARHRKRVPYNRVCAGKAVRQVRKRKMMYYPSLMEGAIKLGRERKLELVIGQRRQSSRSADMMWLGRTNVHAVICFL